MAVTVRDIARHASVSSGTVSRVLNDHEGVNSSLRSRVLESASALGYERPPAVKPASPAIRSIGFLLVIRDVEEGIAGPATFWSDVLFGAEASARAAGISVVFRAMHDLDRRPESIVGQVSDLSVGAALLVGPTPPAAVTALRSSGLPLVLIDNATIDATGPTVLSDNFGGVRAAIDHLVGLGHRRIAFIGGPGLPGRPGSNTIHSIWWRALAYRVGLEEHGLPLVPGLVEGCDLTLAGGASATRRLLDVGGFTALVAANDPTAAGALQALNEAGVRVPDDVSVVGFDDDPSVRTDPPLTTLHVDTKAMGATALRLLTDIAGLRSLPAMTCTLPVHLVIRASTGPAPRALTDQNPT